MNIPLHIASDGLYRMWVRYHAKSAIINMNIYRPGQEKAGPVFQRDEIYDRQDEPAGPAWKYFLFDFTAGDYIIKL